MGAGRALRAAQDPGALREVRGIRARSRARRASTTSTRTVSILEYERQNQRIVDCGDVDIIYTNFKQTLANITQDVERLLKAGALPVVIGGDHAITYPVVRAYEERLNVVHFDAHMDYRPFVHGVQWANGSPMRNVAELKTCHHIIQVGIRSLRTRQADVEDSRARGNDILTVPEFRRRGAQGHRRPPAQGRAGVRVDRHRRARSAARARVRLVRGRTGSTTTSFGRRSSRSRSSREVIGFDLVEVNPMIDVASHNTSLIAAQLIIEFLGRIVENPGYRSRHPRRVGAVRPAATSAKARARAARRK